MKIIKYFTTIISAIFFAINISSCQNNGKNEVGGKITVAEFEQKLNADKAAQIIDVRTPSEFADGFIPTAKNINWNGNSFETDVIKLDKTKPVFVYCLSGGRSSEAATKLKELGFKEVYDLKGGMMAWRKNSKAVNLPSNEPITEKAGMTNEEFNKIINENTLVLVDIYAPWCGPCKKIAPFLTEIAAERKGKLTFLKINYDDNQGIVKYLYIDEIPTIILYKNGKRVYTNVGLTTKEELLKIIDANLKK